MTDADGADWPPIRPLRGRVGVEPQGEQAQFDLRHWDGDPQGVQAPSKRRNWDRLLDVYEAIDADPFWDYLRQPGIRLVPGDGPKSADAKIMIVGEAPGARENGEGKPFVGQSGRILDQLIDLMAYGDAGSVRNVPYRSKCFVTNVVKYRPPGNATPNLAAVLHGRESLREEWAVVRPTLTIAVGSTAHLAIHPRGGLMSIGQARVQVGQPWEYKRVDGAPRRYCISIYHPAYGLRAGKRIMDLIERDWDALGDWLREFEPDVLG